MTQIQEVCQPVASEFGHPPDAELMSDPAFAAERNYLADRMEQGSIQGAEDLDYGTAAARAMQALGCAGCKLNGACTFKARLEDKVESGARTLEVEQTVAMLSSAPRWLRAARAYLYKSNLNIKAETLAQDLVSGEVSASELRAGVRNEVQALVSKEDLPEVAHLKGLDPSKRAGLHRLETDNGRVFTVVDFSENPGNSPKTLMSEYDILTAKLLERMTHADAQGQPQILHPDGIMQKVLTRPASPGYQEMRTAGKNRLYFTVRPQTDNTIRIVILGQHNDQESAQRAFLTKMGIAA